MKRAILCPDQQEEVENHPPPNLLVNDIPSFSSSCAEINQSATWPQIRGKDFEFLNAPSPLVQEEEGPPALVDGQQGA